MGANFYTYNAFKNNCQNFVISVLDANGLTTPDVRAFVFQPVEELLKEQPEWTEDFSKSITNLGSITDRVFQGYGQLHNTMKKANSSRTLPMRIGGNKFIRIPIQKPNSQNEMKGGSSTEFEADDMTPPETYQTMEGQLKGWGVGTQHYLRTVKAAATKFGYDPAALRFATDGKHKLELRTPAGLAVKFGRLGYGDYILWKDLEARGKTPTGQAERKRQVFHKSHEKIKGNWRKNDYSPNNLALRILW